MKHFLALFIFLFPQMGLAQSFVAKGNTGDGDPALAQYEAQANANDLCVSRRARRNSQWLYDRRYTRFSNCSSQRGGDVCVPGKVDYELTAFATFHCVH